MEMYACARVCVNELELLVVFLFNPCPGRQSLTQLSTTIYVEDDMQGININDNTFKSQECIAIYPPIM